MSNRSGVFNRKMLMALCFVLICIVFWYTAVLLLTRQYAVLAALMGGVAGLLVLTAWQMRRRHRPLLFLSALGGIVVCLVLVFLALTALLGV